jgi:4-amino-4-deoxy-L-arabinose transferase-like glycosyltransferase
MRRIKGLLNIKNVFLFTALLLFFFLLRWNSFSMPFERDEGEYAYSAWLLKKGVMPYQNSFLQKPPMIIYTYAFGQLFDPVGVVSPKVLAAAFSLITILLTALIAKKQLGSTAGWITAFLLTPMLVLPLNAAFAANTEHFMLTPLMAVLAIYFYKRGKEKPIHFFWAGVLSSVSVLFKPFPVYLLIFLFLIWFYQIYKKDKSISEVFAFGLMVGLGGVLATLLVLSPFILSGNLKFLIESAVLYNRYYIEFIGFSPAAFITHNLKVFAVYWPLLVLVSFYLIKRPRDWWLYLGFLLIATISIYQSWINHYYIFIMPFMALICSFAIILMGRINEIKKIFTIYFEAILTTVVIIIMVTPFSKQFSLTPQEMSLYIYGTVNPFYEAPLVAEKVVAKTKTNDKVFIAGSEPEILFYAKRFSPGRYVITYPFNITTRLREKYQTEGVQALVNDPPQAIVYSKRVHSGLWNEGSPRIFIDYLDKLLSDKYRLVGGYVWTSQKGFWLDELTPDDLKAASLLLYLKK